MRCCHRANASLKCRSEISDRSSPLLSVGDDSSDGCERVFDAVVEFGIQDFAGLFSSLALGDVDIYADQTPCMAGLIIFYETARLDPAHRSAGTYDAKLCVMLAAPLGK
jgi:hypothetical protein